MKLAGKLAIMLSVVSGVTVATGVSLNRNPFNFMTHAEGEVCEHTTGNHYQVLSPTQNTDGCKEYWVCCICHNHFLQQPATGTWAEKGTAEVINDSSDDRYLPSYGNEVFKGFANVTYDATKKGYIIGSYNTTQGYNVIIPEGTIEIQPNTFGGSLANLKIVIPLTMKDEDLSSTMFKNSSAKAVLFFVGTTNRTPSDLNVAAIYQVQGVGWDYVNGVPTQK